ncbi:MAG TPA: choice-of-anchor Q domain-containing protein [Streptosporangiaceae bacterium]|nr:choice-of-anchor Q domain-containing protein [Streptosporangiaceae bacterium]
MPNRNPASAPRKLQAIAAACAGACLLGTALQAVFTAGASAQPRPAALVFKVNSTKDAPDAHPGDGHCADSAGKCTLRAALQEADAAPVGASSTVTVPAGTYLLSLGTLAVGTATRRSITVTGAGPKLTVISAGNAFRVMSVAASATVTLHGLEVTGGNAGSHGYGGGVFSRGKLTLSEDAVDGNKAGAGGGGVVNDSGTLAVSATHIDHNTTGSLGGGILGSGPLTVFQASFDGNHAGRDGGAIDASGTITVNRSTLAGNTAGGTLPGEGAAIWLHAGASLQLVNSTVANNTTSPATGGAVDNAGGKVSLSFDTFSDNTGALKGTGFTASGTVLAGTGTTPNCTAPVHEPYGYNLSTDLSCKLAMPTDIPGANPKLSPLAYNGGPTETQALTPDSPALDAGGQTSTSHCPATDERGQTRPFGPACDIGAYELKY